VTAWAYYNEIEPAAAHVLRALIAANVIAPGEVDERSIVDVRPDELRGFSQCHFFAGGGLWSVAARLAGWPDDHPLWTGSCPCQPFSVAGKGLGTADDRHLWPHFYRLIAACRPAVCVGEQVSGAAGYAWLDGVRSDLEGENYTCEAFDIPACAVDAPHIRQRLYWVAHSERGESLERRDVAMLGRWAHDAEQTWLGSGDHMGHAESLGRRGRQDDEDGRRRECAPADTGAGERELADADEQGRQRRQLHAERAAERALGPDGVGDAARIAEREPHDQDHAIAGSGQARHVLGRSSYWHDAELRIGADGKARRVKPGIRLLVARFSDSLGRLRAVEREAWERIVTHGESDGDPDETLRILRRAVLAQARRQEAAIGMRVEFHATQILLDFLLCVSATRGGTLEPKLVPQACSEARQRIVRGLWLHRTAGGPPCEWRPDEQLAAESSNAVLALSLVLARLVAPYWEAARDAYAASNRVGMLRIGGNAIVAPLAAEVLGALMDVYGSRD